MFTRGSETPEGATPGGGTITATAERAIDTMAGVRPSAAMRLPTSTYLGTRSSAPTTPHAVTDVGVTDEAVTDVRVATLASRSGPHWRSRYQRLVVAIDVLAAVIGATIGFVGRFGDDAKYLTPWRLALAAAIPVLWLCCAALNRAYEARFLGAGTIEFERIGRAFLHLVALTTFVAYATKVDLSRGFVFGALATTMFLSVTGRYAARKVLHRRRQHGRASVPVLVVGRAAEVVRFSDILHTNKHAGLSVAAACISQREVVGDVDAAALAGRGITSMGDVDSIRDAVARSGARSVAVISRDITGERLRWISWQLEGTDTDLILLPDLIEVAGRRLNIQQVGGLPLLYVAEPEFRGMRRVLKAGFDRVAGALTFIVLLPVMLATAALIRLTSPGPALFFQTRVGKDGKTFRMIKFRSMHTDAEGLVGELTTANEIAGGTLFKMRRDPRMTKVGHVLRRYSLDELPQLANVLVGQMSLVGPRPPLPEEVATYGGDASRRLLVKPGMTGLWQISGRSDLSWEESVRLDLRYVESWSLSLDMIVLMKTASAVIRSRGAY